MGAQGDVGVGAGAEEGEFERRGKVFGGREVRRGACCQQGAEEELDGGEFHLEKLFKEEIDGVPQVLKL